MTLNDALRMAMDFHRKGELDQAEDIYRQILSQRPDTADVVHMLGIVKQQRGENEQAVELFRRAIAINPKSAEYYYNLGNSLLRLDGRDAETDAAFERAVELLPSFAPAWNNLGHMRMVTHRPRAAAEAYSNAIRHEPALAESHSGLAMAYKSLGRVDHAIAEFRRAIELKPTYADAHSNLCYTLHFHDKTDAAAILKEHRAWSLRFADPLAAAERIVANRDPDRRLRIGYISPDFREHPVGLSMLPILPNHDRDRFEVVCFSDAHTSDHVTAELRRHVDAWQETFELNDAKFAQFAREQEIDVMLDLTMHMNHNRLLAFARRMSPVQASFLAYPATGGVSAIDYRITDPYLDPPGETEHFNTETLVRLKHSFWCYPDLADDPPVAPPPCTRNDYVTFGSLNNPCKVTDATAALWSKVLVALPDARLMLHSLDEDPTRAHLLELFDGHGISPDRIDLVGRQPRRDYLRAYDRIDVGLDPLPYNGHFTSCDSFWMGVPVVSVRGETSVGRGGESILAALGLTELLARTPEQFVSIAVGLANDRTRLAELRRTLRPTIRASPLMDGQSFVRDLESVYRSMWRRWCTT